MLARSSTQNQSATAQRRSANEQRAHDRSDLPVLQPDTRRVVQRQGRIEALANLSTKQRQLEAFVWATLMGDASPPPLPTCTLPMNQLTRPESDEICSAYPQGMLDQYNAAEIQQIDKLQEAAVTVNSAEANYRYEVIRLKLMLDGEDRADGVSTYNIHNSSRFGMVPELVILGNGWRRQPRTATVKQLLAG